MDALKAKRVRLNRRKRGIRKRIFGTAAKPRLSVTRSLRNINAQIIDDDKGITLCSAGSQEKSLATSAGGNKSGATEVGKLLADRAKEKGITAVAFDRNGRRFHGRIKALAEAAREGGLKF
ncbi:MAG: 50S ribosomal protein L18 [Planctomycetes bacterium]|nr:50S ribosomal protein L18 [Planctomycetota bacterium]